LATLRARVAANALELARHGVPKEPFYLTGQVGGRPFSVHAEGERVIMTGTEGRKEVELTPPPRPAESVLPFPVCPSPVVTPSGDDMIDTSPAPGTSPLDDGPWPTREGGGS
jgi:hypothetical protein